MPTRLRLALLAFALALCGGCASPDYAGGPTRDDPHAWLDPGPDVTIRAVDGRSAGYANFSIRVAPGLRNVRVRLEHPIESDDQYPFDEVDVTIRAEEGRRYLIDRELRDFPPHRAVVREVP